MVNVPKSKSNKKVQHLYEDNCKIPLKGPEEKLNTWREDMYKV